MDDAIEATDHRARMRERLLHLALYRWWRQLLVAPIDHEAVVARIVEDSGWSGRFAFMTRMSAGIAVPGRS
ncbi:hypothetical protein [Sphingomonas elodea]|uniref:hypothetical protein n=1 Tax=Sphingomonas elodea TaxID=179878 RepID=UPI00026301B1|nr:hypothetical protein [Sphingomonas elodea]